MKYNTVTTKAVVELDYVIARIVSLGRELHVPSVDHQEAFKLILDLKREIDKLEEHRIP